MRKNTTKNTYPNQSVKYRGNSGERLDNRPGSVTEPCLRSAKLRQVYRTPHSCGQGDKQIRRHQSDAAPNNGRENAPIRPEGKASWWSERKRQLSTPAPFATR